MNKENLVIGKIYYKDGWVFDYVPADPYNCNNTTLHKKSKKFYNKCAAIMGCNESPTREATTEEILWLEACIAANQYVEKPIFNNAYQIF